MKNFLITLYGKFDLEKYKRDFREDFFGVEVSMFPDLKEVDILVRKSASENFRFGIHFPLIDSRRLIRDPLFLTLDENERKDAFADFEDEIKLASEIGADYILTHFPKPVILNGRLDWSCWRFPSKSEKVYEESYPFPLARENSHAAFCKLSHLSKKYGVKIILECDALNCYFYSTDLFENLFSEYPDLKMCIDTGRLHMMELTDASFDPPSFIRRMAKYTYLVHLWNVNPDINKLGGHFPVLPEQSSEEGWADIGLYLRSLASVNTGAKVLFEHRSEFIEREMLDRCYKWIESLYGGETNS